MNRWNYENPPTVEEVKDSEPCYVTIEKEVIDAPGSRYVIHMSGYMVRAYWQSCWTGMQRIIAWEPKPTPWDEEAEAMEAAELLVAMRGSDEQKRQYLSGK